MSFGPNASRIPTEQIKENGRIDRLQPSEKDFIGRPGYVRYDIKPDGRYKWKYSFKPNRNGKLTKEAGEVGEMFQRYTRAKTEQMQSRPGQVGAWSGRVRGRRMDALTDEPPARRQYAMRCRRCDEFAYWCRCEDGFER